MLFRSLDYVYEKESTRADRVYLTQPVGGGRTIDYTWRQVVDEARRMAAHLRSLGLQPGDRVAMLSKNCAHFFMAELAIWMGGYTTVAIFPTEKADTIAYILEHSEAKAIFIGKLDAGWEAQLQGIPDRLHRLSFPLAPQTIGSAWDTVIATVAPLGADRVSVRVSLLSTAVSPDTWTRMVLDVSPGLKVSVPLVDE